MEKVSAQELRIGNLIITKPKYGDEFHTVVSSSTFSEMEVRTGMEYAPIELTEDWLKKFGFTDFYIDIPTANPKVYKNKTVTLTVRKTGSSLLGETCEAEIDILTPKYVHQLQNLYFSLTGEELTTDNK